MGRAGAGKYEERLGLSERLLAVRRRRRLTQAAAAREIGLSRRTLSRIENDYVAHDNTRARVRQWLEEQEAEAEEAERAAAARPEGSAGPPAGCRVRRPGSGPGRVKVALEARRAMQRKLQRACRRARAAR